MRPHLIKTKRKEKQINTLFWAPRTIASIQTCFCRMELHLYNILSPFGSTSSAFMIHPSGDGKCTEKKSHLVWTCGNTIIAHQTAQHSCFRCVYIVFGLTSLEMSHIHRGLTQLLCRHCAFLCKGREHLWIFEIPKRVLEPISGRLRDDYIYTNDG